VPGKRSSAPGRLHRACATLLGRLASHLSGHNWVVTKLPLEHDALGRIAIWGTSDKGSHIASAGRRPTGGHPLDRSGRLEHAQMTADEIKEILGNTPHMSFAKARQIIQFIKNNNVKDILELGFLHGVSTCYMAGTLEEKGGGSIVSIDLNLVREMRPNMEELIGRLGYNRV
jgi:hypothetical protein